MQDHPISNLRHSGGRTYTNVALTAIAAMLGIQIFAPSAAQMLVPQLASAHAQVAEVKGSDDAERPAALEADFVRLRELWHEGLRRHAGPWLAGGAFSAVDAFYAPVAFRLQTYGITLDPTSDAYAARLLMLPAMRDWYAAALAEPWRDDDHERDIVTVAARIDDLRRPTP